MSRQSAFVIIDSAQAPSRENRASYSLNIVQHAKHHSSAIQIPLLCFRHTT